MTRFKPYDPSMGITQDQYSQQIAQANEQIYGGGLSSLPGGQLSDQGPRSIPGTGGPAQHFAYFGPGGDPFPWEHIGKPRLPSFDPEPWINKETGKPWESKGRGDMPPGSKAGPTDAPEPWPDDPRLAEYEKGPRHQVGGFPVTNGASLPPPGWPERDVSLPPPGWPRPEVMPTPKPPVMPGPGNFLPRPGGVTPRPGGEPRPPVMEPPPPVVALPPPDIKPLLPPELLPYKPPEDGRPRPTPVNPILPGLFQPPTGQQASNLTYSRGPAIRPPSVRLKHGGSLTNRVSDLLQILS